MNPQHAVWKDGELVFDKPPQWPNGKELWVCEESPMSQESSSLTLDPDSDDPAAERSPSLVVPIQSFAPEPFEAVGIIHAVVEATNGEFTASFFDANLHAVGETETDAIDALKDLILSRHDYLDRTPSEKLALPLQKQQAVLRQFIRRRP